MPRKCHRETFPVTKLLFGKFSIQRNFLTAELLPTKNPYEENSLRRCFTLVATSHDNTSYSEFSSRGFSHILLFTCYFKQYSMDYSEVTQLFHIGFKCLVPEICGRELISCVTPTETFTL